MLSHGASFIRISAEVGYHQSSAALSFSFGHVRIFTLPCSLEMLVLEDTKTFYGKTVTLEAGHVEKGVMQLSLWK